MVSWRSEKSAVIAPNVDWVGAEDGTAVGKLVGKKEGWLVG